MQRGRRTWRKIIAGLLLSGAMATLTAIFTPQNRHLLAHATRITEAPDQSSPQRIGPSQGAHYVWLSDVEAVGLTFEGYEDHAFLFNARTGIHTPIKALNDTFKSITPSGEQHLSPDGKWLMWTGVRNTRHIRAAYGKRYVLPGPGPLYYDSFRVVVTALDGSGQVDWQQGNNLAWLPDSQGWVRFLQGQSQQSLPSTVQAHALHSPQKTERTIPGLPMAQGTVKVLGVQPDNHLLVCCLPPHAMRGSGIVYLSSIALGSTLPVVHSYKIYLPAKWSAVDVILSPSGDRLAWKMIGSRRSYPDFLQRCLPFVQNPPHPMLGLWMSQVDGRNLQEIGHVDAPLVDGWDLQLYDLSWTPNGKHLSFIFHGALWTVPAG